MSKQFTMMGKAVEYIPGTYLSANTHGHDALYFFEVRPHISSDENVILFRHPTGEWEYIIDRKAGYTFKSIPALEELKDVVISQIEDPEKLPGLFWIAGIFNERGMFRSAHYIIDADIEDLIKWGVSFDMDYWSQIDQGLAHIQSSLENGTPPGLTPYTWGNE